ncbi:MAG: DUF2726 domain-containing protein [Bergeyella zoohelcum]|nr:DUF2726 domain-containing protein [Bergeyella zoohelcum]
MEYLLLGIIIIFIVYIIVRKTNANDEKISYKSREIFQQKVDDKTQKIISISNTRYKKSRLMNKPEFKLFCEIENILNKINAKNNSKFRVFPQVVLGAVIQNADTNIKYLRADLLIIDNNGYPCIVVEYQGSGHFNNDFLERDRRKRIACQNAGIELVEVSQHFDGNYLEKIFNILENHSIIQKI